MSWILFCSCFLLCLSEEGSLLTGPCRNSLCYCCASGFLQGRQKAYQGKMKLPVTQGVHASAAGPDHVALWQFIDSYNQEECFQPPLAVGSDSLTALVISPSMLLAVSIYYIFPSSFQICLFFI